VTEPPYAYDCGHKSRNRSREAAGHRDAAFLSWILLRCLRPKDGGERHYKRRCLSRGMLVVLWSGRAPSATRNIVAAYR